MSALTSTGTELRRFRRGTLPKIAIAALILIPLLYGALYLWAFWDPTGNMDRLPVALVNADRAVTLEDGTVLDAGQEVTDTLLDSADLEWVSTDAASAQRGVEDGTYYFALQIPEGFSQDVASAEGDSPTAARLDVTYNDSTSFLASVLGHSAMVQVDEAVRSAIGDEAVDAVLVGLGSARDGFATAADGAITLQAAGGELADGGGQLADGVDASHEGATLLASGAGDAADGATLLATGAHTASAGATELSSGATSLADNLHLARTGSSDLTAGAEQLTAGATSLADNLDLARAGSAELTAGADQLSAGVSAAVRQIGALSTSLESASPALTTALTYLGSMAPTDTAAASAFAQLSAVVTGLGSIDLESTATQLAALDAGAAGLASGASALDTAVGQLATGAEQLATGAGEVSAGASALDTAVGQLATGADQLATGAGELASGTTALADGADTLAGGTAQLADGTTELEAGTALLADGAHALADGADQLSDGAGTLAAGLGEGAEAIPDDSDALRAARGEVISTPVTLEESYVSEAEGFGEGFAPFFIPLALFVGSLITWLLFRPLPSRALATPASGFRATFAGFLPAGIIGVAQVAVMLTVIHLGVGLEMASVLGTIGVTLLVAMAFITLQQMLIAVLGPAAGKVAILALLMLQLASSGGTYPVETTPAFFRAIHDLLPMTYAVTGLREVITGGIDGRLWSSVAVLAAIAIGSLAVTAWRAGRMRTWTLERLHPVLTI
ncbi:YhgE/Pip family protein [Actinotalea sp.]|uniref:YhgE/Pip family protein n=1 Tax=Actinotalea sp. TaxID=1872145 RepID=UPI003568C00D